MQDATVKEMIVEFLDGLDLISELDAKTIVQYRMCLNEFNEYMFSNDGKISDIMKLKARDIIKNWINVVKEERNLMAASLNQRVTSLSGFYKFLIGEQYNLVEVTKGIPKFKDKVNDKKKHLSIDEAKNIIHVAENSKKKDPYYALRDELIIKLFLGCGLRKTELSLLTYNHINVNEEKIYITEDIAKFHKSRVVDVPSDIINLYKRFLTERINHKNKTDFLFISTKNNPIHVNTIADVVKNVSIAATGEKARPHMLRHTYGTHQVSSGQDIVYISQQMGHANVSITTGLYVHQTKEQTNRANKNPMFAAI